MARYSILSTLTLLILAAPSSGASIRFEPTSEPTPGMATHRTWTLRAISDYPMQGFDFAGDGSNDPTTGRGFFGPMNQVNPAGIPTIYSDNNQVFTACCGSLKQESQFLVRTSDVVVPAGFSEEGPNILQGIWAHAAPVGLSFDIAQIVIPRNGTFFWRGVIVTLEGTTLVENAVFGAVVPEPASAAVAGLAAMSWLLIRRAKLSLQ